MEDGGALEMTPWNCLMSLPVDLLVQIFQHFDIFGSPSTITDFENAWRRADFANAWRRASSDSPLWQTLDFSMLKSYYIMTTNPPYVYVASRSENDLTTLLRISLNLSRGNIMTLIFHYNLFLSNVQFRYTAESCPHLRRLVMPAWDRIEQTELCRAICCWKELESLTMPTTGNPRYLLNEIGTHCENFSKLKIMGSCDMSFASSLAEFLPKLKVLSLRCTTLYRDVLVFILDSMQHLEVLNISHCILVEAIPPSQNKRIIKEIDVSIRQKASRLREFLTCMEDSCIMCQRTRDDEGIVRWYKYDKEGLWKTDEVRSLAL